MKNSIYKYSMLALFSGVLLSGCDAEIDAPAANSGQADFTRYVALGNSLTAGFSDGALYSEGQLNSYPAILAEQFELVGGSQEFVQPLMPDGKSAGSPTMTASGTVVPQKLVLGAVTDCTGKTSIAPVPAGAPGAFPAAYAAPTEQGPYNNLGVPGAKAVHLLVPNYGDPAGYATGTANPFFVRFASSPSTTVIADAMAQDPTFFTLWIGNNDVLGYALSGGVEGLPTDASAFKSYIETILTRLTAGGAKGAVGSIPDVSKIPYFTTVPYNGLVLNAQQAAGLTAAYGGAITFKEGANPFIVNEDGQVRPIKPTEFILLPASNALKCEGAGSVRPLEDKFVLSEDEIMKIKDATTKYNTTLKSEADRLGLAYADFNGYLNKLSGGITQNGVNYNSSFVTGNIFSLDGIHFTPRGAALAANEFIRAINAKYNSTIPTVDETQYRAVLFP